MAGSSFYRTGHLVGGDLKPRNVLLFLMYKLPSGLSCRALFMYHHHAFPHLRNPETFSEKMNWRILYDRRKMLEWTCDKLAMKEYAAEADRVRVPRTFWAGTDIRELANIDLPECWVLKPNHRSGKVFFGHGRPDISHLTELSAKWLHSFEGENLHEWAYLKARPMLLVEELLGIPGAVPADYKFFVFGGTVALIQVDMDRHTSHSRRLYLPDWTPTDATFGHYRLGSTQPAPVNLQKMLEIVSHLASPFDFIRIDLYAVDGGIYFGELTPYPASGLDRFIPYSLDAQLGAKWEIPRKGTLDHRE